MNIFVLNTGRCGSVSFIQACQHITNYTALHESRSNQILDQRLAYPDNHIEADNRLSWVLGRLDQTYGDEAFYVHLRREREATAASFARRDSYGIMKAYREGILLGEELNHSAEALAYDYIDTVESNIALFLKGKSHTMEFHLEYAKSNFETFWQRIGAKGDLKAATKEWDTHHNRSTK